MDDEVVTGPKGERAHRGLVEHSKTFAEQLHRVTDRVFCAVGYGLANSTMIVGDGGAIVVDTGDGIQEAKAHLKAFRTATDAPVRAIVYSHFHYVDGTRTYVPEGHEDDVEIWAHERLPDNMAARFGETGPHWSRRAMLQFGALLPTEGEDAMPNFGIGPHFFHPKYGRGTPGYVPPNRLVSGVTKTEILGVRVELTPAPSDSDDTVILWLPDDAVAINNHVWPAFYNVYPLRGEPYRDPLVVIDGIDRIRRLEPEHLIGVHGPPISGRAEVARALTEYRDGLQFIWDQTVRAINAGCDVDEVVERVRLPQHLQEGKLTRQYYGLVRHHVRQIYNGLFGWFGAGASTLLPVTPLERARKIVEGFGGRDAVLRSAAAALESGDAPWAAELAEHLVRLDENDHEARRVQAGALRHIAQRTPAANVRAFCLAEALELEGKVASPKMLRMRATSADVLRAPPGRFVRALRVQLDPDACGDTERRCELHFTDTDTRVGLVIRRGVAEYVDGELPNAELRLELTLEVWAKIFTGQQSVARTLEKSEATLTAGDAEAVASFFACFDDVS